MAETHDFDVRIKGCFDPDCCGDAIWGVYFDCPKCKETIEGDCIGFDYDERINSEDAALKCPDCGFEIVPIFEDETLGWLPDDYEWKEKAVSNGQT